MESCGGTVFCEDSDMKTRLRQTMQTPVVQGGLGGVYFFSYFYVAGGLTNMGWHFFSPLVFNVIMTWSCPANSCLGPSAAECGHCRFTLSRWPGSLDACKPGGTGDPQGALQRGPIRLLRGSQIPAHKCSERPRRGASCKASGLWHRRRRMKECGAGVVPR